MFRSRFLTKKSSPKNYCQTIQKKKSIIPKVIGTICFVAISVLAYKHLHLMCLFDHERCFDIVPYECTCRFVLMFDMFKTQQMCDYVVKINPALIEYVPHRCQTQSMCDNAVETNPKLIEYVSDQFKSPKMCDDVFKKNIWLAKYIPDNHKTDDMCNKIVKYSHLHHTLPDSKLNFEFIRQADPYSSDYHTYKWLISARIRKQRLTIPKIGKNDLYQYLTDHDILKDIPATVISSLELNDFDGMVVTGQQFIHTFSEAKLLKLTNDSNNHHGFKFKQGRNDDRKNFDPLPTCDNGLYVTEDPKDWVDSYNCNRKKCHLWDVNVLPESIGTIGYNKLKFDIIELNNCREYQNPSVKLEMPKVEWNIIDLDLGHY